MGEVGASVAPSRKWWRPGSVRLVWGWGVKLLIVPITQRESFAYVKRHHRHHRPPRGSIIQVAVADEDGEVHGVAIVGRPVARMLADGWTVEVIRVATDGTPNACSKLYGACWRAVKALGYRRLITYTLPEEGGASLRGAGFTLVGEAGGGHGLARIGPVLTFTPLR